MYHITGGKQAHYIILLALCVLAFFVYRGVICVNQQEARNFITAREMLESGNWLYPTMNGEPRLAKPPLPTWITAAFALYFGLDNVAMMRFPACVMASLLVFFMYAFSYEYTKNRLAAFMSSLVLVSSFYMVYVGRAATWDIYCHSFMLGAIYLLYTGLEAKEDGWIRFAGAGVLLGLSFMSKGPVAFYALLLPFAISYVIVNGYGSIQKKLPQLLLAFGLFALISLWWPIYAYLVHAGEARSVIAVELQSWLDRHTQPFWWYWFFPAESGAWTLVILTALIYPFVKSGLKMSKTYRFALLWTVISVALLSFIPEKKDTYLMPVLIPAAMLAAQYLYHLYSVFAAKSAQKIDRIFFYVNSAAAALAAFIIPFALYFFAYRTKDMPLGLFAVLSIIYFSLFCFMLTRMFLKDIIGFVFGIAAVIAAAEAGILPVADDLINRNPDFKDFGNVKSDPRVNKLDYYYLYNENFRSELIWEVGKEVHAWDFRTNAVVPEQGIAVFSDSKLADTLPSDILRKYDIKPIDHYDRGRKRNKKNKRSKKFFKYLSIVKDKSPGSAQGSGRTL